MRFNQQNVLEYLHRELPIMLVSSDTWNPALSRQVRHGVGLNAGDTPGLDHGDKTFRRPVPSNDLVFSSRGRVRSISDWLDEQLKKPRSGSVLLPIDSEVGHHNPATKMSV
jgi:hypothetical protein